MRRCFTMCSDSLRQPACLILKIFPSKVRPDWCLTAGPPSHPPSAHLMRASNSGLLTRYPSRKVHLGCLPRVLRVGCLPILPISILLPDNIPSFLSLARTGQRFVRTVLSFWVDLAGCLPIGAGSRSWKVRKSKRRPRLLPWKKIWTDHAKNAMTLPPSSMKREVHTLRNEAASRRWRQRLLA
ncbi:hypothetical protein ES703_20134 [subsurface metagenome]